MAWVRVDTQTILTIHNNVITRNPRISLARPGPNQWHLHIQRAQESDRGWYMCQVMEGCLIIYLIFLKEKSQLTFING